MHLRVVNETRKIMPNSNDTSDECNQNVVHQNIHVVRNRDPQITIQLSNELSTDLSIDLSNELSTDRHKSDDECPVADECETERNNNNISANPKVVQQLRGLAEAFAKRGEHVKRRISQPVQTSSGEESKSASFRGSAIFEEEWMQTLDITRSTLVKRTMWKECWHRVRRRQLGVFEPQSSLYISWLFVVSVAFVYNAVIIFLRCVFPYETSNNRFVFFICDYICDGIYIMDMIWFKMRLKFIMDGQWVEDTVLIRHHYLRRKRFISDVLSLLPLDLLYFKYGFDKPLFRLLRLNRLFKATTFWEFFTRIDAITKFPYFIRIIHTLMYKMYLIHLSSCAYYLMSSYEGFGSTPWTYNNEGNAYLRCFYFAFRTATSIGGRMPKPTNDYERIYMIVSWLMGVFVFALLIGQIRDIVATATQNKTLYKDIMNKTVRYMRGLSLPHSVQKRVRLWLAYTWNQQKTFDENKILDLLPLKMRTDLALSIHYHTLSRVELFKDCERTLLRDLVLKFRSVLCLPGDFICKKGDIGHEMYIVNKGHVCVMDPNVPNKVLVTLSEVFGEISILGIEGYNRRTADVRSTGYSYLFVLSKSDLMETLKDYPEYKENLMQRVRRLMKCREAINDETKAMDEIDVECIVNPAQKRPKTPRLVQTVLQVLSADSRVSQRLSRASHRSSRRSSTRSSFSLTPTALTPKSSTHFQFPSIDNKSSLNKTHSLDVQYSEADEPIDDHLVVTEDSVFDDNKSVVIDKQFINDIVYEL
ncbi:unnamed protein product [Medioppia subpectinata]|uniref:Cyclic nucleotide-binding domain-containing protein n=1 Tax=Medioppia subpectinata TaxID=1979941 RepID=A0A7R9KYL5_9ACAR|nr:unnamed protein product [Medioppia subpectinata]CAG2112295.1 unnamed protein product [Medioppia subpectinata]